MVDDFSDLVGEFGHVVLELILDGHTIRGTGAGTGTLDGVVDGRSTGARNLWRVQFVEQEVHAVDEISSVQAIVQTSENFLCVRVCPGVTTMIDEVNNAVFVGMDLVEVHRTFEKVKGTSFHVSVDD